MDLTTLLQNIDINKVDKDGDSILIQLSNNTIVFVELLEIILQLGANPNLQNNNGLTALIIVCWQNIENADKIVELLLKYGADPNLQSNKGNTALMTVCYNKNIENPDKIVEILLNSGADPNILTVQNDDSDGGISALMHVCNHKIKNANKIVELLLKSGADVNFQDNKTKTSAIMDACNNIHKEGKLEIIKILLDFGANPNAQDIDGFTPLMFICYNNMHNNDDKAIAVDYLINCGADVNIKNNKGKSALEILLERTKVGNYDKIKSIIKLFIKNGVNINYNITIKYQSLTKFLWKMKEKTIKKKNERIKELEEAFKYIPGNEGAIAAKNEFKELSTKKN